MKKAYVICFNHLDVTWRRCFKDHFYFEGNVIKPYIDIEEALFNKWIKIIGESDCNYSIEQSMTVKEYLKGNPDKIDMFKKLVTEGRLELLGGGEAIIDYNMVQGESIVRSHLYSILWYKDNFNKTPDIGIATDTFGLSAQLPQIYRKLGYDALTLYSRVFEDSKPFWRGLDGEIIYFKQDFKDMGLEKIEEAEFTKYPVCTECSGEGCRNCDYTGVDYSYKRYTYTNTLETSFKNMKESSKEEFILMFSSEEIQENDNFKQMLEEYSSKYDITIEHSGFNSVVRKIATDYLYMLKNNSIEEKDIDERVEGNPIGTGCYVSRIELKKLNRKLEDLMLSSEKFAVLAEKYGMPYPSKKLKLLWNKMSFFQFHDSITSTHVDAAYEELKRVARNIEKGALQIYKEAMETIEKRINIPKKEGYEAFVMFNPLNWDVEDNILEAVIKIQKNIDIRGITIEDATGKVMNIIENKLTENMGDNSVCVRFIGASIKAFGFKVFYYKLQGENNVLKLIAKDTIENEFYSIKIKNNCICEIYDKELKETILQGNVVDIIVEEDFGSPWETLITPYFRESIFSSYILDHITKRDSFVTVRIEEESNRQIIIMEGLYHNSERKINKVAWKQQVTLYKGIKKIYFKTDIDWDAYNHRLLVQFPLSFKTPNDEAYYEIPYGTLKRKGYKGEFGKHMSPNGDWPALNFVSCRNEEKDYIVTLINKGLPCHKVSEGIVCLSLLRSPLSPIYIYDNKGVNDEGKHSFEYMLTSNKGSLRDGQIVQKGMEFNTEFMNCNAEVKTGTLSIEESLLGNTSKNVIITSLKKAEEGEGLIIRAYEAYGDCVRDCLYGTGDKNIYETNLLENEEKEIVDIEMKGFEIKTLKLRYQN